MCVYDRMAIYDGNMTIEQMIRELFNVCAAPQFNCNSTAIALRSRLDCIAIASYCNCAQLHRNCAATARCSVAADEVWRTGTRRCRHRTAAVKALFDHAYGQKACLNTSLFDHACGQKAFLTTLVVKRPV